jgi:hypothetical protein
VLTLLGIASTVLACYFISCRFWPITACSRCGGAGKLYGPSAVITGRRVFKTCKRCAGTGGRLRIGRRVMNGLSRNTKNL